MNTVFRDYSVDEVFAFESVTYFIQVGSEVFNARGKFVFDKRTARTHYNRILRELVHQIQTGDVEDRINAERILENLRILPLRLH